MTLPASALGAVVLAGGRSTRLGGVDKTALQIDGVAMLTTVLTAAAGAGAAPIVVMGASRPDLAPPEVLDAVRFVADPVEQGGPAAALAAAIATLGQPAPPYLFVLAADLPHVSAEALRDLASSLATADPGVDAVVPVDAEGRSQWLFSVWRTTALHHRISVREVAAGTALHRLLGPARTRAWRPSSAAVDPEPWRDCDTPEDLHRARRGPK